MPRTHQPTTHGDRGLYNPHPSAYATAVPLSEQQLSDDLTRAMKALPTLPVEERPAFGAAANAARGRIEAAIARRAETLHGRELDRELTAAQEEYLRSWTVGT